MIKWDGFGKLLKQGLFTLLISCFILLGSSFVSSARVQMIGLEDQPSIVNSNYTNTFLKGGGLLTNYLGQSKGVFALDYKVIFWWGVDGFPYFYADGPYNFQGTFKYFYSCPLITGLDYSVNSSVCSPTDLIGDGVDSDFNRQLFQYFFSRVRQGDYVYYDYANYNNNTSNGYYHQKRIFLCFSSEEVGMSLCFLYDSCYGSQNSQCNGNGYNIGDLVDTRNYTGLTFSNLPYSEIGYAPGNVLYDGSGSSSNISGSSNYIQNPIMSGDVSIYRCTNHVAKTYYQTLGYSDWLCFAGTNYTGTGDAGNIEPEIPSGLSLYDIWNNWSNIYAGGTTGDSMTLNSFFGYWRRQYSLLSDTYNPFVSVPTAIQIYFENVDYFGYKYDNRTILDYCSIVLNSSGLDNDYNGSNRNNVCSVINLINPENGSVNSSGVIVGSDWSGIFGTGVSGSSGTVVTYTDGKTFSNNYFNLLKDKFLIPDKNGLNSGVLPGYIIGFLLLLILFRFLSK